MASKKLLKSKLKSRDEPKNSIPSFIRKTYDILEEGLYPEIIDWNPEGDALVIKNPSEFCARVLPSYFKHNNLTSFVRQLNMYNFHKKRTQKSDHVYYHELFLRGKRHLLKDIKRKNQEQLTCKTPKSIESPDSPQSVKDMPSILYENKILKCLCDEAITKINALESQMKELSTQNQSLWSQICQNNEGQPIQIPPLSFQPSQPEQSLLSSSALSFDLPLVKSNISTYLNLNTEEIGESTQDSYTSPSLYPSMENEGYFEIFDSPSVPYQQETSQETFQVLPFSLADSEPQSFKFGTSQPANELAVTRQNMSSGQFFASWDQDLQTQSFRNSGYEPKLDKINLDVPSSSYELGGSLLGKRHYEQVADSSLYPCEAPVKKMCQEGKESLRGVRDESILNEMYNIGSEMEFNPVFSACM